MKASALLSLLIFLLSLVLSPTWSWAYNEPGKGPYDIDYKVISAHPYMGHVSIYNGNTDDTWVQVKCYGPGWPPEETWLSVNPGSRALCPNNTIEAQVLFYNCPKCARTVMASGCPLSASGEPVYSAELVTVGEMPADSSEKVCENLKQ